MGRLLIRLRALKESNVNAGYFSKSHDAWIDPNAIIAVLPKKTLRAQDTAQGSAEYLILSLSNGEQLYIKGNMDSFQKRMEEACGPFVSDNIIEKYAESTVAPGDDF